MERGDGDVGVGLLFSTCTLRVVTQAVGAFYFGVAVSDEDDEMNSWNRKFASLGIAVACRDTAMRRP